MIFLLLACNPSHESATLDPCTPGDNPTLTIGKGELVYTSIETDNGTEPAGMVELIHGPQGGFHVVIALEATFLDAEDTRLLGHITGTIDGVLLADTAPLLDFRCNPDTETLQSVGTLLIWDAQPEELDGKTAIFDATVEDASGNILTATGQATIFDPSL